MVPTDLNLYKLRDELLEVSKLSQDTCLHSPSYIALTGRKSAKLFSGYGSKLVTCHHPNKDKTILVLPEIGEANGTLLNRAILHYIAADMQVQLVRVQHDYMSTLIQEILFQQERRYHDFSFQVEKRLDWAYPVRIFDCERVIERKGKDFERLRRRYNHVTTNHTIDCVPLDEFRHKHQSEWVDTLFKSPILEQKVKSMDSDYYYKLFELIEHYPDFYDGLVFFDRDQCVGLSIWEAPINTESVSLVNICNLNYQYLSIFQVVQSCIKAKENGIGFLNFGGSETEGLDRFKRSIFKPVRSLTLLSAQIMFDTHRGRLRTHNINPAFSTISALENRP